MKNFLSGIRATTIIATAILLTIMSGCNQVLSKRPVGEKPAKLVAADWEGQWLTSDGLVKLTVVDANKGLLKAYYLEAEDGTPVLYSANIELRESGEWMFGSFNEKDARKADDKAASKGFLWARVINKDRQIIIWAPDDAVFTKLVESGVFPGKTEQRDVFLDELKPQHLKIITSGERGVLFKWDEPLVLVKVGK